MSIFTSGRPENGQAAFSSILRHSLSRRNPPETHTHEATHDSKAMAQHHKNDILWWSEQSDSSSDDDEYMIAPTNPSGGWRPRHKIDEFHIRVADQIDRIGGLAHPSLQKICQSDVYSWASCPMCSQATHMDFSCLKCLTRYCSLDCRRDDGAVHRFICGTIYRTPHIEKGRPFPNTVQALIFPAQGSSPIQVWVKMNYRQGDDGKQELVSLSFQNDEFWSFATQFNKSQSRGFRMGCINECTMLQHRRLGKGLFILEWALNYDDATQSDIPLRWLNESITKLGPPGHMWYWTGPILILACDPSRCKFSPSGKPTYLDLLDFEPRDMRSVADFFQLHPRNPVIIDPLGRRPNPLNLDYTYAYKINDISSPVARRMGVCEPVERVMIPLNPPLPGIPRLQAPSLLANRLGLNYVLRNPHNHGQEFNPSYRHLIMPLWNPHWLGIIRPDEATQGRALRKDITAPSTDTIILIHRTGLDLPREYIDAMLKWVPLNLPNRQLEFCYLWRRTCDRLDGGPKLFGMWWDKWREEERVKPQKKGDEFRKLVHPVKMEEAWDGVRTFCVREYKMIDVEFEKLKKKYLKQREYAQRNGMTVRKFNMGNLVKMEGDGMGPVICPRGARGKVEDSDTEEEEDEEMGKGKQTVQRAAPKPVSKLAPKPAPVEKEKPVLKGILKNRNDPTNVFHSETKENAPPQGNFRGNKDKGKGKAEPAAPKFILQDVPKDALRERREMRKKGQKTTTTTGPIPDTFLSTNIKKNKMAADSLMDDISPKTRVYTDTDTDSYIDDMDDMDDIICMDPDAPPVSLDIMMEGLMKEVTDYLEDLRGRSSSSSGSSGLLRELMFKGVTDHGEDLRGRSSSSSGSLRDVMFKEVKW